MPETTNNTTDAPYRDPDAIPMGDVPVSKPPATSNLMPIVIPGEKEITDFNQGKIAGYGQFRLSTGKMLLQRKYDKAVLLPVGMKGNALPKWVYAEGDHIGEDAPAVLSSMISDAPRMQPWITSTGKVFPYDSKSGGVYSELHQAWLDKEGNPIKPETIAPFESNLEEQKHAPATIAEKIKAIPKEIGSRALGLASGFMKTAEEATKSFEAYNIDWRIKHGLPVDPGSLLESNEKPWSQSLAETAQEMAPRRESQTLTSRVAGMAPILAAATNPSRLAAAFAGNASQEVDALRQQGYAISPAEERAYIVGNGALALLPIKGGKFAALGENAAAKFAARTLTGAGTMEAFNLAPQLMRSTVLGTGEDTLSDYLKTFKQNVPTSLALGIIGAAGHTIADGKARPKTNPIPLETPASLNDIELAARNIPEQGQTALNLALKTGANVVDAHNALTKMAEDPENTLTKVGGKFVHAVPEESLTAPAKGNVLSNIPLIPTLEERTPNALQEQRSAQEVPRNGSERGNLPEDGEGIRSGQQGQEAARTGQEEGIQEAQIVSHKPETLEDILSVPKETRPKSAIMVIGPSGSGRTTEATAALSHMPDSIALDGTTQNIGDLGSQLAALRRAGVEPSVMGIHPSLPVIVQRALDGKGAKIQDLADQIYGPHSSLSQFIKAGNQAKLEGHDMPMHLKVGDSWLEGDAALQKARDFQQILSETGPVEGSNRIADMVTKELMANGEKYEPKTIKSILDSYPESRQADAAALYSRFGIEPSKKSMATGSIGGGGEAPGAPGPNAAEPNSAGLVSTVPGRVWNSGPAAVQTPGAEAAPGPQAPGIGQAPGGFGGEAPGGPGTQTPTPGEAPQGVGFQSPALKQSFTLGRGENAFIVPLMTPEHQIRYANAEQIFNNRMAELNAQRKAAFSEAESPAEYERSKAERQAARVDATQQFNQEKYSILAEAAHNIEGRNYTDAQLKSIVQNVPHGTPEYALAHQAHSAILNDNLWKDKSTARDAFLQGANNFADFSKILEDEFQTRFSETKARQWFNEISSRYNVREVLQNLKDSDQQNFAKNTLDFIHSGSAVIDGTDGAPPQLPPDWLERGTPGGPVFPSRDATPAEIRDMMHFGSTNQVLKGILSFGKDPLYKPGEGPLNEMFPRMAFNNNLRNKLVDWGQDLFKGMTYSGDKVNQVMDPLREDLYQIRTAASPLARLAAEKAKDVNTWNEFKGTDEYARLKDFEQKQNSVYQRQIEETHKLLDTNPMTRVSVLSDNAPVAAFEAGSKMGLVTPGPESLRDHALRVASIKEKELAETIRGFYQQYKGYLDQAGIPTFDPENAYTHHPQGLDRLDPKTREAWMQERRGGNQRFTIGDEGTAPEVLPENMNFGHRDPRAPNMMPDAAAQLQAYIPLVSKKLAFQPFLDKWGPALDAQLATPEGGTKPQLSLALTTKINQVLHPDFGMTWLDKGLGTYRAFEYLKDTGYSIPTAYKHANAIELEFSNLGAKHSLNAILQNAIPDSALNQPWVQKAFNKLGMEVQDPEVVRKIKETLIQQKNLDTWAEGVGLHDKNFEQWQNTAMNAAEAIKHSARQPVSWIERWKTGVNIIGMLGKAQEAGMAPEETARQIYQGILDTNFSGQVDPLGLMRPTPNASANNFIRTMTMFSSTPLKVMEQRLAYIMQPNAVDAFGTQNAVKVARTVLWLGTIAAMQDVTGVKVFPSAFHIPIYNPLEDQSLRMPPIVGVAQDAASMIRNHSEENLKAKARNIMMPAVASKALNIASGELPKGYANPELYALGLKGGTEEANEEIEAQENRSKMFEHKTEKRENRSARKANARFSGKLSTVGEKLKQSFSTEPTLGE